MNMPLNGYQKEIIVILPFHNRRAITERLILCLKRQTLNDFHLLLIDDGSTDRTAAMAKSYFPSATVIYGKGKWWWAGSLQQGYKWIRKQEISDQTKILILNDDVEFGPDFLKTGVSLLDQNSGTLILAKSFSRFDSTLQDSGVKVDWKTLTFTLATNPEEINVLATRGLFLHNSTFRKIGGFHPMLIPHYQSDYEFTHRAYRKGFSLKTFDSLFLFEDPQQTGLRSQSITNIRDFLKMYFSKRSTRYLISWISFILLASPWRWKARNIARILRVLVSDFLTAIKSE
jgi:GT2 family glycosyltransferase